MRVTKSLASCFTYSIGKNLYVPLTSRSNARTLPETRGPNFLLEADVVGALCRVRDEEHGTKQWAPWCLYLDTQENKQRLPPALEIIASLPEISGQQGRLPCIYDLLSQIHEVCERQPSFFESIVLAGEGEPTLRLDDMLKLANELSASSSLEKSTPSLIRLTTNGLVESPKSVVDKLKASGISSVSVALMTANPQQYEDLMVPAVSNGHKRVCDFIEHAVNAGLDVETTGVDRPDVDKVKAEELSRSLKVLMPMRWRPFFP